MASTNGKAQQAGGLFKRLSTLGIGGHHQQPGESSSPERSGSEVSASCSFVETQSICLQTDKKAQDECLTLLYGAYSEGGLDTDACPKENQDSWVIHECLGGVSNVALAVFDGHGQEGERVSRFVAATLPGLLAKSSAFKAKKYRQCTEEQFLACNAALKKQKPAVINSTLSGSTGALALLRAGGELLVAGVGDSRCMLGRLLGDGSITSVALTTDHTPELPAEAERIRAKGGRLEPYKIGGEFMGPKRVWLATQDTPGLSMTRAFGDTIAASVGVICQPDIMEVSLGREDAYMVLCSDGIYEFMSNDEIIAIVHEQAQRGAQPATVAKLLVRTARAQWIEEEEGGVDDCTAIVCYLAWGKPDVAEGTSGGSGALHGKMLSSVTSISRRMSGTPLTMPPAADAQADADGNIPAVHGRKPGSTPKAARMTVVPTATMLETLAEAGRRSSGSIAEAGGRKSSLGSRRASEAAAIDSLLRRASKSLPAKR